MWMNSICSTVVSVSLAIALGGCASHSPSPESTSSQPTAERVALMSLAERAALIQEDDPISRVEVLLGEPVYSKAEVWEHDGGAFSSSCEAKYYLLSPRLVAVIDYKTFADSARMIAYVKDNNPEWAGASKLLEKIRNNARESVRNGYPDLTVSSITVVSYDQNYMDNADSHGEGGSKQRMYWVMANWVMKQQLEKELRKEDKNKQ